MFEKDKTNEQQDKCKIEKEQIRNKDHEYGISEERYREMRKNL